MADDARQPDPDLLAEAAALLALLGDMHHRTIEGDGETMRFTLTVPKELAILAAWMAYKADREGDGEHGPLPRAIHLRRESDNRRTRDWYRARDIFMCLIVQPLMADWNKLANGTHSRLFRPDPEAPS